MKKILLGFVYSAVFTLLSTGITWSAEVCVNNATNLQTALTIAQTNGEDDTIKVVQGTYNGNFIYSSSEGHSITLLGGVH